MERATSHHSTIQSQPRKKGRLRKTELFRPSSFPPPAPVCHPPLTAIAVKDHHHSIAKMLSRAAIRTSQAVAGRRAFHATPSRFSSPYHYPEGPYSNLPFNPKSKYFGVGYWTAMSFFFFAPMGIATWQTYKPK